MQGSSLGFDALNHILIWSYPEFIGRYTLRRDEALTNMHNNLASQAYADHPVGS